jgi:Zn-dependent alcohol dehydrogenase
MPGIPNRQDRYDPAGEVDVSGSVSETVPLEQINQALQRLAERKGNSVRVVVR